MKHLSKIIGLSALAIAGLAITLVTVRGTQANSSSGISGMMGWHRGGQGVSGSVTAISGNSITLNSNGTSYTVDASNAQEIEKITGNSGTPSKTAIKVSDIQVGDTLRVDGQVSGTNVRAQRIMDGNLPAKQNPAATGSITGISGNTITLNSNGTTYTVDAGNARLMVAKSAGTSLASSGIVVGDQVSVYGSVNGTNITATAIVDGSLGFVSGHMGMRGMMNFK